MLTDLDGNPLGNAAKEAASKGKMTQAQAGAVVVSEIDIAIENWNKNAMLAVNNDAEKAHLFSVHFDKFQYAEEAAKASGHFGYAELSIVMTHQKKRVKVYTKAQGFIKEQDLDNTNGYYPSMVFDCMGMLLASGLMYNLALAQENPTNAKEPTNAKLQRGADNKDKPGAGTTGRTRKTSK